MQVLEQIDAVQDDLLMPDLGHVQFHEIVRAKQQQSAAVYLIVEEEVHVRLNAVLQAFRGVRKRMKLVNLDFEFLEL